MFAVSANPVISIRATVKCLWCSQPVVALVGKKYCSSNCRTHDYYRRKTEERAVELLRDQRDFVIVKLVETEVERAKEPLRVEIERLKGRIEEMRMCAARMVSNV